MEVIPNEMDYARIRVNNSDPLYKLSEFGEMSKVMHFNLPSTLESNQRSPNSKNLNKNSSPSKNLTTGTNFTEGMYNSFHIKIPANLVSMEYFMKSLKHHRKTQSINDLSDLFMGSLLSNSGDISRCTSERWNFDFLEKPVVTRKLPKYPLNFNKFSSESGSTSSGIIHTKWKDGLPYFEFSLRGKGGEYFVANPLMVHNLNSRVLDYIYLFHKGASRKNGLNFVGMMEVSSSLILNPGSCCNYVDTEFVLFSTDTKGCDSGCSKNRGFIKKASEILRSSKPFSKSKSMRRGNFGESSVVDESSLTGFLSPEFPSKFESCATVLRSHQIEAKKESISGGWGLNFLRNVKYEERNGENCGENGSKFGVELSVLLPSGVHGSPDTGNGGPSRLIDRWKSGGLCDCGGWDLGCPITVLKSSNSISNKEDLLEVDQNGTVDLSIEGSKQGNPVIRLCREREGVNMVFSNTTLSALQCFSAGIAVLHQQIPELCRKI